MKNVNLMDNKNIYTEGKEVNRFLVVPPHLSKSRFSNEKRQDGNLRWPKIRSVEYKRKVCVGERRSSIVI